MSISNLGSQENVNKNNSRLSWIDSVNPDRSNFIERINQIKFYLKAFGVTVSEDNTYEGGINITFTYAGSIYYIGIREDINNFWLWKANRPENLKFQGVNGGVAIWGTSNENTPIQNAVTLGGILSILNNKPTVKKIEASPTRRVAQEKKMKVGGILDTVGNLVTGGRLQALDEETVRLKGENARLKNGWEESQKESDELRKGWEKSVENNDELRKLARRLEQENTELRALAKRLEQDNTELIVLVERLNQENVAKENTELRALARRYKQEIAERVEIEHLASDAYQLLLDSFTLLGDAVKKLDPAFDFEEIESIGDAIEGIQKRRSALVRSFNKSPQ